VPAQRSHPHRAPWPITITINTVPALRGIHLRFDGQLMTTGADGRATYTAEHDFTSHKLVLVDTKLQTADRRYQFSRWAGQRNPNEAFTSSVTGLPLRSNYAITAAFTVQQQVTPRFVESNGSPLDLSRVSAITLKSDAGQVVPLPALGTAAAAAGLWLDSVRPTFHNSALTAQPASYSLQSVIVSGANVVDSGRQTFKPSLDSSPTFSTLFYNLTISGHDALFGSSTGTSATVTYPDGTKHTVRLDAHHTATLMNLPRGTYKVHLRAGRAIVANDQFVLSKDKAADEAVISGLDLVVLGVGFLLVAVALLLLGRIHWRNRLVRRFRRKLAGHEVDLVTPEDVLT
jgi:hypothetical protein